MMPYVPLGPEIGLLYHISPLEEYCQDSKKKQLFMREEKPNFNLTSWNCKVAMEITIVIFGYKELYNVPKIGLQ